MAAASPLGRHFFRPLLLVAALTFCMDVKARHSGLVQRSSGRWITGGVLHIRPPQLVFEIGSGFDIAPKPKTNDMKTHKTYCCVRPVLLRVLAQHSLVLSLRQIEAPGESSAWHRGRSGFRIFACLLVRDAHRALPDLGPSRPGPS